MKKRRTRKGNPAVQISPTPLHSGCKRIQEGIKKSKRIKKEKIENSGAGLRHVYHVLCPCLSLLDCSDYFTEPSFFPFRPGVCVFTALHQNSITSKTCRLSLSLFFFSPRFSCWQCSFNRPSDRTPTIVQTDFSKIALLPDWTTWRLSGYRKVVNSHKERIYRAHWAGRTTFHSWLSR